MVTASTGVKAKGGEETRPAKPPFVCAVVIEDVLVNGYEVAFETLRGLLPAERRGSLWDKPTFIRCGGDAVSKDFLERVAALFEMSQLDKEMLGTSFSQAYNQQIVGRAEKLSSDLAGWLEEAKRRGALLVALSLMPEEQARAALQAIQTEALSFQYESLAEPQKYSLSKRMLKLTAKWDMPSSRVVLVTASPVLAHSALEAGWQCVAVPNEYTSHADFSGCSLVLDSYRDISPTELWDSLFPQIVPAGKR